MADGELHVGNREDAAMDVGDAAQPVTNDGEIASADMWQQRMLVDTVCRHPLSREPMFRILEFCRCGQALPDIEAEVASYPEFGTCTLTQHEMVRVLERSGGLDRIERDAQGEEVTAERKQGLSADEAEDLVASIGYVTTAAGVAVVQQHDPSLRIAELVQRHPQRKDAYLRLARFIDQQPRTYVEISTLLKGDLALASEGEGGRTVMQSSVLVDNLCRAGAIVWEGRWCLTEEGKRFLREG